MREIGSELKDLRLHGMASAWADLDGMGPNAGLETARWLIEHLLQAEHEDRAMRSVRYQLTAARLPVHRDLAGFDFDASSVDRKLVEQLATMAFTEDAHNAVFVGGTGTGKSHLATAIAVAGITQHGKRVSFTRRSTWSTCWSRRRPRGARGASPPASRAWTRSSSIDVECSVM